MCSKKSEKKCCQIKIWPSDTERAGFSHAPLPFHFTLETVSRLNSAGLVLTRGPS